MENDGEWLHELALNNTVLETLNFYMTYLEKVRFEDLELIARNCRSLVSVKVSDYEILELQGFFRAAAALEEFCGGSFSDQPQKYSTVSLPPNLCRLGLSYMGKNELEIVFPYASLLKKLDLLYALLDTDDHCMLIQRCPNLEVLEVESQNHFFSFFLLPYHYYLFFSPPPPPTHPPPPPPPRSELWILSYF
jgi:coronatine-insensitive protein 1